MICEMICEFPEITWRCGDQINIAVLTLLGAARDVAGWRGDGPRPPAFRSALLRRGVDVHVLLAHVFGDVFDVGVRLLGDADLLLHHRLLGDDGLLLVHRHPDDLLADRRALRRLVHGHPLDAGLLATDGHGDVHVLGLDALVDADGSGLALGLLDLELLLRPLDAHLLGLLARPLTRPRLLGPRRLLGGPLLVALLVLLVVAAQRVQLLHGLDRTAHRIRHAHAHSFSSWWLPSATADPRTIPQ